MPKSTSGPVLLASILSGLLIGFFAGAYIIYAWAPPELVLQDAPPRSLAFDGSNPQYRDLYVVSIANRYAAARDKQRGLREAADFLGVTSGDTTVNGAVEMLSGARKVVSDENRSKGTASRFTTQDEVQLSALSGDLEKNIKDAPQANALFGRPSEANRLLPRIVGFIILIVLAALAFLIIKLLGNRADRAAAEWASQAGGPQGSPSVTVNQYSQAPPHSDPLDDLEPPQIEHDLEPLEEPADLVPRGAPQSSASSATVTIVNPPGSAAGAPANVSAVASTLTGAAGGPALASTLASATAPTPTQTYIPPPMAGIPAGRPSMSFPATTYNVTDPDSENYEESFQITGTLSELLGECGANVAERVGEEPPRRVPALAIWSFDKQLFSTTTKVLITEGAAADPAWRARLAAKGEPVIAREGGVVEIVTTALRVEARVSGLTLDPSRQYFETVTLNFSYQKR